MKAYLVLDDYPPYFSPDKLYQIVGQSEIDPNIYFVITDLGSTTSIHKDQLRFIDDIRDGLIGRILRK